MYILYVYIYYIIYIMYILYIYIYYIYILYIYIYTILYYTILYYIRLDYIVLYCIYIYYVYIYMQYNVTLLSSKLFWIRLESCWESFGIPCYWGHVEYYWVVAILLCWTFALIQHLTERWYQDYSQCVFQCFRASLYWSDGWLVSNLHATLRDEHVGTSETLKDIWLIDVKSQFCSSCKKVHMYVCIQYRPKHRHRLNI